MENNKKDKQLSPWESITKHCSSVIPYSKIYAIKNKGIETLCDTVKSQNRKRVYAYIMFLFYIDNRPKFEHLIEQKLAEYEIFLNHCCKYFAKVDGTSYANFQSMYDNPSHDSKKTFYELYAEPRSKTNPLPRIPTDVACYILNELAPEFGLDIQLQSISKQK